MMDKKTGKFLTLITTAVCLLVQASTHCSLSLIAKDIHGTHIQQAEVGIPFTLELVVVDGPAHKPSLPLPPEITVLDSSVSASYRSINGKASGSRTYTYRVRVDQEGTFLVGPAEITTGHASVLRSELLQLRVTKELHKEPLIKPFFLESAVQPSRVYVGQQAVFTLRFYYATDAVSLQNIEDPVFNNCYATKMQGPVTGTEKRDGVDYRYVEWRSTLYPKKEGQLVIPALAAHISVSSHNRQSAGSDIFSLMESMFSAGRVERHYAQPVTVEVMPLPEHTGPVHGVGNFTSYTAKVQSKTGSVGEGLVVTLELVGTGNTQAMVHPELIIPEDAKYYDSHAKEKFLSDVIKKKDFEYIVQFLQPGQYTVPSQKFTFFDPGSKKYKTLTTAPVNVSVTGVAKKPESKEQPQEPEVELTEQVEKKSLAPIYTASWRAGMPRKSISWPLYLSLLYAFVGCAIFYGGFKKWSLYRARHADYYRHKYAYKKACKALVGVRVGDDAAPMYLIIKQFFADKLKTPEAAVSAAFLETVLERYLTVQEQQEWQQFFNEITRIHFSSTQILTVSLKKEVQAWLDRLEKVLP